MSTGGGQVIGAGVVQITADEAQFQASLQKLPAAAAAQIDLTIKSIQSKLKAGAIQWNDAFAKGDTSKMDQLAERAELLHGKLNQVKLAAIAQGDAIDAAGARAAIAEARAAAAAEAAAQRKIAAAEKAAQREAIAEAKAIQRAEEKAQRQALAAERAAQRQAAAADREAAKQEAAAQRAAQKWEDSLNRIGSEAAAGSSRGAQALYQVGAAVDDLQYGFRGVLNNIPQIAVAMGASGLAGAIAIAATAAYQLYTHWDSFSALLGQHHVKTTAEHMKELADATERAALAQFELNRANEREATRAEQQGQGTRFEEESKRQLKEAVKDIGSDAAKAGIRASGLAKPAAQDVAETQRDLEYYQKILRAKLHPRSEEAMKLGALPSLYTEGGLRKSIAELQGKIKGIEEKAVEDYLADVTNSRNGRREQLAEFAAKNPGAFGPKGNQFAAGLLLGGPAAAEQREKDQRDYARQERMHKLDKELSDKKRQETDAQAKLEAEGRRNAEKYEADRKQRAEKFAGPMAAGPLGRIALERPGIDLKEDVSRQLRAQGKSDLEIQELSGVIAEQIRKKIEEQVGKRAGERGISGEEARRSLLEDAEKRRMSAEDQVTDARKRVADSRERIDEILHPKTKASFTGLTEFAKSTQLGALNQEDKQKQLIQALDNSTKAEKDLKTALDNLKLVAMPGP